MIHYSTEVLDTFKHLTDECKDETRFTQDEMCFVLEFLADTLSGLTQVNSESLRDENAFVRMQDCSEVADNYVMLLNKHKRGDYVVVDGVYEQEDEYYTFTLQDAGAAICSYDTEYRECITEQFEDALNEYFERVEQNKTEKLDIANCLAWRIFNSY
jgi:predicted ribosome quality control (RQC) complex YloA/Tae2 family protein